MGVGTVAPPQGRVGDARPVLRALVAPTILVMSRFVPRPAEGLNYPNVVAMFRARAAATPELTALRFKEGATWRSWTWREWEARSQAMAAGLREKLGIRPGDRIAIMAESCRDWAVCDLAIAWAGAVSVPIYTTVSAEDAAFILEDSGARALITGKGLPTPELLKLLHRAPLSATLENICEIDPSDPKRKDLRRLSLASLVKIGARAISDAGNHPSQCSDPTELSLESIFSIVYTSGTTGTPKGVVLTHKNVVYEAWALKNCIATDRTDEHLVVLPMAHIFARHMVWAAVESGAVTAFGSGPSRLAADLQEIAPTYVGGVPRMYEKIREQILAGKLGVLRRRIVRSARAVGEQVSRLRQRGEPVPALLAAKQKIADKLVFRPLRQALGGRLRFFISGAAPLSRELTEFFHASGILLLEGYGLTETSGATHVNRPDRYRFGTVGPALPGCEILIADDGEVLLRGHNVMRGYYGLAAHSAEALDPRGWLHSGDVGEICDGFLTITGRKKDIIITAGGKNIAPIKVEGRLRAIEGIAHVLVLGDTRPYLVALINLDAEAMMEVSETENLGCRDYAELSRHPRIRELLGQRVAHMNRSLAPHESVRRFHIPLRPFSAAEGEVTPTDKVRRAAVLAHFSTEIDRLYGS